MTTTVVSPRLFEPGTTGWTAHDLEDPAIEREWFSGRYEIINGVLTKMAPSYFAGTQSLEELVFIIKMHLKARGVSDRFSPEADIVIDEDRVVRADAVWMSEEDLHRQRAAMRHVGKTDILRTRILISPTLIIECISPGHERHDEGTKRRWYAEFGVPNYWILNPLARSLKCLILEKAQYRIDAEGQDRDELHPALFPGLTIPLSQLWLE